MRLGIGVVVVSLVALPACHRAETGSPEAAIRQAIEAHLKQDPHLSLQNFTTKIVSLKLAGSTADALVRYQSKQSPAVAVLVKYTLQKKGAGWEVTSSAPAGGQGMHGMGESGATATPTPTPSPAPLQPESSH